MVRVRVSSSTPVETAVKAHVARMATAVAYVLSTLSACLTTPATWGATVRGTYPTPEAGTRTPYVQYGGPWGKPPCASGTYPTREAGTRSVYVPNGGPGAYVSAQARAESSGPSTSEAR